MSWLIDAVKCVFNSHVWAKLKKMTTYLRSVN